MPAEVAAEVDVLVVGAGPTGLTVALSLLSRGRAVTVVDNHEEGDNTSRAAVVYPGTLELLDPYGVAERLTHRGIHTPRFTVRDRDRVLTPVRFDRLPTAFPYALLVSQADTEAVLLEQVKRLGGKVFRPRTVTRADQDEAGVTVTFSGGEQMRAAYLVGADGAHSVVREQAGIGSSGEGGGASYTLADVHLSGGVPDDELVVYFSPAGHLVVLPLPGGLHRVVAHVVEAPEQPDVRFIQALLDTRGPETERAVVHDVVWGSRFLTRHAVVNSYRAGRIVLAGDAAHVHSPLGGQGMNLGINDAIALGRALSEILEGGSSDLLDSYSAAQRLIAKQVITATIWLTRVATMPAYLREIRNLVVVALRPLLSRLVARRLSLLGYLKESRESHNATVANPGSQPRPHR